MGFYKEGKRKNMRKFLKMQRICKKHGDRAA